MTDFEFDAPTVIRIKRDGGRLSDAAIDWVIDAYTEGRVAPEQMSALLMAIVLQGMDRGETARWTSAMLASGPRLDFSDLRAGGAPLVTVDKHSTGGVGDKITLPLVPVVVACGGTVPQASGRGLGHTGGTLDKLESISGFTATLSNQQVREQLCDVGAAIFAAGELAPVDAKLYALRDITGTVESLPLIASSIMSKKLAEGAGALVLDVKVGSGAFLKSETQSRELAHTMVELGAAHGVPTRALLTDMNCPLGSTVGNALEVAEALEVLDGGGPPDVVELTVRLAAEMLDLVGIDGRDPAETLRDGSAMDRFRRLIAAQGESWPNRCRLVRIRKPSGPAAAAQWATSMRWRWGWRHGGSARAGPAPAHGSSTALAFGSIGDRGSRWRPVSPCSRSIPTPPSGSAPR